MPYVDLVAGQDDYASLWYTTNSPTGTVGGFDPNKPIMIMLHPIFLDSEWLYLQLQDPRLDDNFNIIAFDARCAGRTQSRPNGKHDHWTDAADLAFAIQVRLLYTFVPFREAQKHCTTSSSLIELFRTYPSQALWLPPAHIWACESFATNAALRLAALYVYLLHSLRVGRHSVTHTPART